MHRLKQKLLRGKRKKGRFFLLTAIAVFVLTSCMEHSAGSSFRFSTSNDGITFSLDKDIIQISITSPFSNDLEGEKYFEIEHVDENTLLIMANVNPKNINTQEINNYFQRGIQQNNAENSLTIKCTPKKKLLTEGVDIKNDEEQMVEEDSPLFQVNAISCKIINFSGEVFSSPSNATTGGDKTSDKKLQPHHNKIIFPLTAINFQDSTTLKLNFTEKWRSITSQDWISLLEKFSSFSYRVAIIKKQTQ